MSFVNSEVRHLPHRSWALGGGAGSECMGKRHMVSPNGKLTTRENVWWLSKQQAAHTQMCYSDGSWVIDTLKRVRWDGIGRGCTAGP